MPRSSVEAAAETQLVMVSVRWIGMRSQLFPYLMSIPSATRYTRLGVGPEATAEEVRAATARHVRKLRAGGASEAEIAEVNGLGLTSSEPRAAYDAEQPPLELLRFEPCSTSLFADQGHALVVLRRELEKLLLSSGASVYFPTDVNRSDFSADFVYTPGLDMRREVP
jgi:hypothetical protein